jgi:hypothetical protein
LLGRLPHLLLSRKEEVEAAAVAIAVGPVFISVSFLGASVQEGH